MKKISQINQNVDGTITITFNDDTEFHLDYSTGELSINISKTQNVDSDINILIDKDNKLLNIDYPNV